VQRQEAECRVIAEREGWTVVEVLSDNDISAYSGKPRPGYRRLLDLLGEGAIDVLLAWHPDRFTRYPRELEDFIDAVESAGPMIRTVQAGDWDLSTPAGRQIARIMGAIARGESELKSERLKSNNAQAAQQGKVHGGGTRPYGFESDRVTIREDEAQRVREGIQHVCRGGKLHSLADRWNHDGLATVTGKPWRTQTLLRMLTSPRIAGLCQYNGVFYKAVWPALVDRESWESARAALSAKPRRYGTGTGTPRKYLLTGGPAKCGVCGAGLVARPKDSGKRAYQCVKGPNYDGCGKLSCLAEPVEDLVRDMVLAALDGPGIARAMRARAGDDREARRITEELDGFRQRLLQADEMFVEGDIDRAGLQRMRASLIQRIEDRERALARIAGRSIVSDVAVVHDLRGFWDGADLERRRALVALAVESVVIHPATRGRNTFDSSRVEVVWAQ
jgi:DNA invertase Pin-like site-specific DNA recombinase